MWKLNPNSQQRGGGGGGEGEAKQKKRREFVLTDTSTLTNRKVDDAFFLPLFDINTGAPTLLHWPQQRWPTP